MLKSPALPAALAVGALFHRQQSDQDLPMRSVLDGGITLAPFESVANLIRWRQRRGLDGAGGSVKRPSHDSSADRAASGTIPARILHRTCLIRYF
jgi:hypothetical protein